MHTTGENNERRAPVAMQKYKQLNLPLCYQHISGGNPKIGPQKPLLLATNFPAAKDPFVRIEFELRSIFKDIKSSSIKTINGSKALEIRLSTGLFILVFAYQVAQLLEDIEQAKLQRRNIAGLIQKEYGSTSGLDQLLAAKNEATKKIDAIAAKATQVLNGPEYNTVRDFLNKLGTFNNAPGGAGYQGFSNTVNSLAGSTLGATNAQGFLDGFNKSLTQFDQWTKQASQAIGNADKALGRWQQSQRNLVRDFKNQIASFNKAYAAAKPERDALAAVQATTSALTKAGFIIMDRGSKAEFDGKKWIRFSTATKKTTTGHELIEDQVFAIPVKDAASVANIPFNQLNQYLRKYTNTPISAFGPERSGAVRSEQTGTTGPVAVSPEQNAALSQYNEMTFKFTGAVRRLLYNSNTSYALTGDTSYGIYNNQYVQLLSVNGRYHFAIPLTDIYNNQNNFDAFLAKGLRSYLLPGRPSEKIKLIEDLIQGVKIAQKPVESTPLGGDPNPEDSGSYIKPETPPKGAGGVTKPGPLTPTNTNPSAQRPKASAEPVNGEGEPTNTASVSSQGPTNPGFLTTAEVLALNPLPKKLTGLSAKKWWVDLKQKLETLAQQNPQAYSAIRLFPVTNNNKDSATLIRILKELNIPHTFGSVRSYHSNMYYFVSEARQQNGPLQTPEDLLLSALKLSKNTETKAPPTLDSNIDFKQRLNVDLCNTIAQWVTGMTLSQMNINYVNLTANQVMAYWHSVVILGISKLQQRNVFPAVVMLPEANDVFFHLKQNDLVQFLPNGSETLSQHIQKNRTTLQNMLGSFHTFQQGKFGFRLVYDPLNSTSVAVQPYLANQDTSLEDAITLITDMSAINERLIAIKGDTEDLLNKPTLTPAEVTRLRNYRIEALSFNKKPITLVMRYIELMLTLKKVLGETSPRYQSAAADFGRFSAQAADLVKLINNKIGVN
jgi:hypothetical protein